MDSTASEYFSPLRIGDVSVTYRQYGDEAAYTDFSPLRIGDVSVTPNRKVRNLRFVLISVPFASGMSL